MVDKIRGNSAQDFTANHNDAGKSRTAPGYEKYSSTPLKKETAGQASAHPRGKSHASGRTGESRGVILELSSENEKKRQSFTKQGASLFALLWEKILPVFSWIKNFWESDAGTGHLQQDSADGTETADIRTEDTGMLQSDGAGGTEADMEDVEIEALPPLDEVSDIPDYEAMLAEAVKSRDLKKMEQILTQNGAKRLARSSDLLTYYDRWGRLVELDDAAKRRVLFGDKHTLKL